MLKIFIVEVYRGIYRQKSCFMVLLLNTVNAEIFVRNLF